jgi:hypothetical protein
MISLIANSGIQFYQSKVNLTGGDKAAKGIFPYVEFVERDASNNPTDVRFVIPYYWSAENIWIEKAPGVETDFVVNREAINVNTWEITDESKLNKGFVRSIQESRIVKVRLAEALDVYEGEWLPLPYFKVTGDGGKLHSGPSSWARVWINRISPAENGNGAYTHNVVVAFDTNVYPDPKPYFTPDLTDAGAGAVFQCAADDKNLTFFNAASWVTEMLENIYAKRAKQRSDLYYKYLALYFVLIKALAQTKDALPEATFHTGESAVEVDLILDLGNSRTCGILVETNRPGAPFEFNNAMPIVLRDLTNPDRTYTDSFEMKLSFVKQTFGYEPAGALAGHDNAFVWPSMVRVGPEATRLNIIHENLENISLSSPKKYLWDKNKRLFQWNYISEYGSGAAMFGIGKLFTQEGVLMARAEREQRSLLNGNAPRVVPALNAYYSRSSLMTFALIEIILQTLSYVNSFQYRDRQGNPLLPRKLKRIVLTCPTAMLDTEKRTLRESAVDAVAALKTYFGKTLIDEELTVIPDVEDLKKEAEYRKNWGYDEATCSQLSFLYGEIFEKFKNKHKTFFQFLGKKRLNNSNPDNPSVMIASVDIGGGTTDLMICNYECNPDAHTTVLKPDPQFWEGFNIAGDTIMKSVIERLILPTIRIDMEKKGGNSQSCFPFLFGPYLGMMDARDKIRRRQFANEIANCIAVEYLRHASFGRKEDKKTFGDFFIHNPSPNKNLINYLNEKAQSYGAVNFNIQEVVFTLDTESINAVVRDVIEKMIHDLCQVIVKFNCDYLLLAGRPTMLPVVTELFLKYLPVMPDRIVPLGNFKAGAWYPFANEQGVIRDPKTCVAVGATVALMGGLLNRLGTFSIDTTLLREKFESTANYIGRFESSAQRIDEIYFSDTRHDIEIQFYGELLIGMRQLPRPGWIGTMMYKLAFAGSKVAQEYNNRLPFTVLLERSPDNKEAVKIGGNITDRFGSTVNQNILTLSLQTIADEAGHWLDTGIFSV